MLDLAHLPNQKPQEQVVLFLRPFWFALLGILLALIVLFAIPLALALFFSSTVSAWLGNPVLGPILVVVITAYTGAIWLFAFVQYADYYLDTWIITTHRVLSNEQIGLFSRITSELHLSTVQDVTSEVVGFLPTMFNYGTVYVQTAAEKERFDFEDVPNPEQVKETILRLVEAHKAKGSHLNSNVS